MEETRTIKRVGYYSTSQAKPEDCTKCHNAIWGTILIDDICLDCFIKLSQPLEAEVSSHTEHFKGWLDKYFEISNGQHYLSKNSRELFTLNHLYGKYVIAYGKVPRI